jgi:hypothetical protein
MAVGDLSNGAAGALIEQWDGSSWSVVYSGLQGTDTSDRLMGIDCPTTLNCLAVGERNGNQPLALAWNGTGWWMNEPAGQLALGSTTILTSVSCPSTQFCAVVGAWGTGAQADSALMATFGTATGDVLQLDSPSYSLTNNLGRALEGVSCTSSSFCLAVGDNGSGGPATATEWNGTSWVTAPGTPPSAILRSVSCVSSSSCTAVGFSPTFFQAAISDFDGSSWVNPAVPSATVPYALTGISCPYGFCVATGSTLTPTSQPVVVDQVGSGDWTDVPLATTALPLVPGAQLLSVSCAGGLCKTVGTVSGTLAMSGTYGISSVTPPEIISSSTATFLPNAASSFDVISVGTPTPVLTEAGALPAGLTFVNNGNGTATLSGTPSCTATGTYPITLTADNGESTPATQILRVTVTQSPPASPAFESAVATTATAGTPFSFTVSTNCNPVPAITALAKDGVKLVDNHNGTATLAGTPLRGGVNSIAITAKDALGTAKQLFTLTVLAAPAFTGATTVQATTGMPFTSVIKSTGFPTAAIASSSTPTLPSGVSVVDQGNGTAILSGTAPLGSFGAYVIRLTATNGVGTPATKTVTLKLNEAPVITSGGSVTVARGVAMAAFPLTATGYPAPTITGTGLPTGLGVHKIGSSYVISGTPAKADSLGSYTVTIVAKNSKGIATLPFALTLTA